MSFDLKMEYGDLVLNNDFQLVYSNEKLIQDMAKMVLTTKGSNPYHPGVGSTVTEESIGRALGISESQMEASISEALELLSALQSQQSRVQRVSPGELLAQIQNITVVRDETDSRQFNVLIEVLTQELEQLGVTVPVRVQNTAR